MIPVNMKTFRLGAALLAIGFASGTAAWAQEIRHVYGTSQLREDHGQVLSRHLRTLAESPRNSSALLGAGEAALALGDPQTALTFFARAEEVTPRDGRVKAGMGSAFLLLEQPVAALRFFNEAASFGIPAYRFAGDRGLAYDLTGDPKRAQADYRLALQHGSNPAVRERLGLSLAISGDREAALEAIEELVRRKDRSAWRARAFILALTGDTAGATEATRAVMPAQASAMQPFFARLPWLTPAERAMAVHFGRIPEGDTRSAATASQKRYASTAPAATEAGKPDHRQPALTRRQAPPPEPVSSAPRRRPDDRDGTVKLAPFSEARRDAAPRRAATPPAQRSGRTEVRTASRSSSTEKAEPADPGPASSPALASTGQLKAAPSAELTAAKEAPAKASTLDSESKPAKSTDLASSSPQDKKPPIVRLPFGPPTPGTPPRMVDISEIVAAIPEPISGKIDAKVSSTSEKAAPSRHWVQIAGGANKEALPRAFERIKEKAPELLSGKTAWTTPLRFTNRLLVGPFDSESEAQAFVNKLVEADLGAFSWTSAEGQEIEKLAAK